MLDKLNISSEVALVYGADGLIIRGGCPARLSRQETAQLLGITPANVTMLRKNKVLKAMGDTDKKVRESKSVYFSTEYIRQKATCQEFWNKAHPIIVDGNNEHRKPNQEG